MSAAVGWAAAAAVAQPDLRGYSGAYPFNVQDSTVHWGDNITLQLAVANYGSADAGAFKAGIYLSIDTTIGDASDYLLVRINFSSGLKAGYYGYLPYTAIPLPSVNPLPGQPTTVYVGMVVDVDSQVAESNEGNNRNLGGGIDRDDTPVMITPPVPDIFATDSAGSTTDRNVPFADVANDGPGNARGVQTVSLINKGKGTLTINSLALSGSPDFSIAEVASSTQNFIQPSSLPRVLAKNGTETWVITLQFDPTVTGAATGTLTVNSDDPDTPALAVSLSGNGVPVPDIALTSGSEASEEDFGGVVADGNGGFQATRTISLRNIGTGVLTVQPNGVSLLTGTHYRLVSITSSTQGAINLGAGAATLAPSSAETWAVVVRFDPLVTGRLNDGLRVLSDDPDEATFTVSLTGLGQQPMTLVVTDPSGDPNDRAVAFPDTHADGPGKETASATVSLRNAGDAALTVAQNGLSLAARTHFRAQSVVSDKAGAVDLSTGPAAIAGKSSETWTVTLQFDPGGGGSLTDTLAIISDDPAAPVVNVALSGQGVVRPAISVADSVSPATDLNVDFGAILNDGTGGRMAENTLTIKNLGASPLIVAQNGIGIAGSTAFGIVSVVSSTRGPVNLASANDADRTIAVAQAEFWTVTVSFDPAVAGPAAATLQIASTDPVHPAVQVALSGSGATPAIMLTAPAIPLNVSAGSVFEFKWDDAYPAGDARIALYLDDDSDPSGGLIPIVANLSEDSADNAYTWRVDPALVGGPYHVYATISDGSVIRGNYAAGTLTLEPSGSFVLRSPSEVTSPDYAYEYEYAGQVYTGVRTLHAGYNTLTVSNPLPGGGTATFQFGVNLVPSLIQTEHLSHDELNRVVEVKNGNGITTTLSYDSLGRLVKRASSNGAVVEFGYDVLGRRTSMTDSTGATFYEWDGLDRLTAVITSKNTTKGDADDLALRYEYDLAGRKTAIVYPGGERIQYTYDDAGRMLTVNNVTRGLLFTYAYNPANGLLTKLTRPNGIDTLYSYDSMGRLTNIRHQKTAGDLVANYAYTLDTAGKATEFRTTEPGGVERVEHYTYDRFDRLTTVVYSEDGTIDINDKTVTYTYDGNGNRLSMTTKVNNAVTEVRLYEYGNENRLLRVTDGAGVTVAEYGYDAAGNTIRETTASRTRSFSYDERNLLTSVIDGSNHITYAYNGDGQRIGKTVNGIVATFVVDANRAVFEVVQERGSTGAIEASYTLGGRPLSAYAGLAADFDLPDRLGTVRHVADPVGTIKAIRAYDAFGNASVLSGTLATPRFGGQCVDHETEMIYMRARYYAPDTGRFLEKDPLGVNGGVNSYLYCHADPVNTVDPLGLDDNSDFVRYINGGYDYDTAYVHGIRANQVDAESMARSIGIDPRDSGNMVIAPFRPDPEGPFGILRGVISQSLETAAYALGVAVPEGFEALAGKHIGTMVTFSGGAGAMRSAQEYYGFTYDRWVSSGAVLGPQGYTELFSDPSHGHSASGRGIDLLVGSVIPRVVTYGDDQTLLGVGITVKGDNLVDAVGNFFGGIGRAIFGGGQQAAASDNVGGVLLDKAAELVGSNLSDLRGAVYDPVSGQFVFLGTDGSAAVKDIDLDYLWTALNAVYGSAVPPFVTLDPPTSAYTQWQDYGDGDGVFEPGEKGGFILRYNPIWSEVDTTVDVKVQLGAYECVARFDCVPQNIYASDRRAMKLVFNSWVTAPPSGLTLNTTPWQNYVWSECSFRLSSDGQDFLGRFTLYNGTSQNFVVDKISVIPARQHRKFGGRVENTRLGWVMLEADRVMKCLSVGKDNLTGAAYNSTTIAVSGYLNMTQRGGTGNIRMWFTPNMMTLKRHLDPDTGRASVVFDQASVALNTESFMMGLPQPPEARAFADHFTAHYDEFAALSFPCVDPNDPTGTAIVNVKVFDMLKDAMQAVALARFFRDNDVPVDMWWLNSWQPQIAYSPKSTPTAYNEENGMIIYGGVQVNKPNTYVPSATAKSVADVVQAARPAVPGDPSQDIREQVWSAATDAGNLKAVAAQTEAEPQDGNVRLAEVDLSFASPGALRLQFGRFYQSAWLGRYQMGPGWRYTPFALEFERPSWFDENSLMKGSSGAAVWKDSGKNTRLRSGMVRVVDLRRGAALDFASSLVLGYAVDNIGNTVITISGLDAGGLPTFTPGNRKSGATLVQLADQRSYLLTTPDGAKLTFDHEGRLLQSQDRNGKKQTYAWDAAKGILLSIADDAGQTVALVYNAESNRVVSVTGPASEQVNYTYASNGCLERATHVRSGGYVQYTYNAQNQLTGKRLYNGLDVLLAAPDLRGRANETVDLRNNALETTFSQDGAGAVRTTETVDPSVTDPQFVAWQKRLDRDGRLLAARDATGAETLYGYDSGSLLPNRIDLPIAGRPPIGIARNEYGQPTRISDPGNTGALDVTATYDGASQLLTSLSDPAGRPTETSYDAKNNLTRLRRHLGAQSVDVGYGYTASGALHTVVNPLGVTAKTINRDSLDRVTSVVDATGVTISYEYDSLQRLWKVHDPRLSGAVEYVYDSFDRVIEIRYPVGSVFYSYDAVKGWLVSQTDLLGRVTRYVRDPQTGDMLQAIDEVPGGTDRVTTMTYNRFGQLATLTPPDAHAVSFAYDDLGRPLGSSEVDAQPPGAPKALDSNNADDGVPTTARDHVFTWGAPDSDSGIAGYSYAFDSVPDDTIDTTVATAIWKDVSAGTHTFQVKAESNNGLWGPPSVFHLIVSAPPTAAQLAYFNVSLTALANVRVRWGTLVEYDVLGYHVDRSTDQRTWLRLTRQIVPATGGNQRPQHYSLADQHAPVARELTYRLMGINLQGQETVLAVASVQPGIAITISEASDAIRLILHGASNTELSIESATKVTGPWAQMQTITLDENGTGTVTLTRDHGTSSRFYRASGTEGSKADGE